MQTKLITLFLFFSFFSLELFGYSSELHLTQKEKAYLLKSPIIHYVYDPNWKPLEWRNGIDQHEGMIADLLKIVEQKSGITLEAVSTRTWIEALQKLKNQEVEMVSAASYTKQRATYLNFTKHNLFSIRNIFLVKQNDKQTYSNGFKDLKNKRFAVIAGYSIESKVKQKYPNLPFTTVKNVEEGFRALQENKIDVFILNQASAQYFININNYKDQFKIAYITDITFALKVAFAKNAPPEALSIIDKTLTLLSPEDINKIYQKWFYEASKIAREKLLYDTSNDLLSFIPFKEMVILIILLGVVFYLIFYFVKKEKISLNIPVSLLVLFFLFSTLVLTINSLNNLKYLKKQEVEQSLESIVSVTYQSIKVWFELHKDFLEHTLYDEEIFHQLQKLLLHQTTNTQKLQKDVQTLQKNIHGIENFTLIDKDYNIVMNLKKTNNILNSQEFKQAVQKSFNEGYSYFMPQNNGKDKEFFNNIQFIIAIKQNNKVLGAAVVSINAKALYIITKNGRMGQTGETYIVNSYDQFISQSRFDDELHQKKLLEQTQHSFLNIQVHYNNKATLAIEEAHRNYRGSNVEGYKDYRGVEVFGSWVYDDELNIVIITEIDRDNAMRSFDTVKVSIISVISMVVIFTVLLLIFILFLTNYNKKILKQKNKALQDLSQSLELRVEQRTKELQELNKHMRDSIEYASLIQHALIPEDDTFKKFFPEYFHIWKPKDIVGGDIYFCEEIYKDEESVIIMVIDCTGHGVPGAFVTMLVKAIEKQLISKINLESDDVSPAWILSYFNQSMKKLLKQETQDSISNAGFDGGVIYYNKKDGYIKYAGAETSLFYINEQEELKVLKGNHHSIGYKKSKIDYKFNEYFLHTQKGMKFYITTDGYIDQNGGEKGFPFGKKRFSRLLSEINSLPFKDQELILLEKLKSYQLDYERNDDVTVIGFKI